MGHHMSYDYNELLSVFPPKGVAEDDALSMEEQGGVFRAPGDTRPLGLLNVDVKIVDGASYHEIRLEVHEQACPLQRGFVAQRNFLNNVTELDTWARIYDIICPELLPIIVPAHPRGEVVIMWFQPPLSVHSSSR